jgi:hypothetical protein
MFKTFIKCYFAINPFYEDGSKSPMGRDYLASGDKLCNDWMLDPDSFINKLKELPELKNNQDLLGDICDLATDSTIRCLFVPYQKWFQAVLWNNPKEDNKGSFCFVLSEHDEYGINKLKENASYQNKTEKELKVELVDVTGVDDDIPF